MVTYQRLLRTRADSSFPFPQGASLEDGNQVRFS
jgi:hypothetical protein